MKIKAKNLRWLAGRPVVFLNKINCEKNKISLGERIKISYGKKNIYAIVDISEDFIKENEIGLSQEIYSFLKNKNNSFVNLSNSEGVSVSKLIKKKLDGKELSKKELEKIVKDITNNNLSEGEIAFFVSAERCQGMSTREIVNLTSAMVNTGKKINFNKKIIADKHCIGGIAGNRTTPIVISICAAAGLTLPKTSSRAITSAAGTADVMEVISKVEFSIEELKKIISKTTACLAWNGTLGLSPTDDKIIKIERTLNLDVEPQLIASILSKKIAAGSTHVLIDIPYGGGKIKTKKEAKKLGRRFRKVAKFFNLKLKAVYTEGYKPIGNGIGPILELKDLISVLKNSPIAPTDLKEKSIYLASELMSLCGIKFARRKARKILESGEAYKKFKKIINEQNGKEDFSKRLKKLKTEKFSKKIFSSKSGRIIKISNKEINTLCRILGTPESKGSGVYIHKKEGNLKRGELLMTLYSGRKEKLDNALEFLEKIKPIVVN